MYSKCWKAKAVIALMLLVPFTAMGQNAASGEDDNAAPGQVWHNYVVRQSIEFGERIAKTSGNSQMYETLVDLHSGPRLLGQELWMQPLNRDKSKFDNLYLNSFGFGGDPDDMARLRIEKAKWYNFVGLYRRDKNYFDDNLFANPLTLNPGITNCSTVIGGAVSSCTAAFNPQSAYYYTNSPHLQEATRNMGDFNLTLFPNSMVNVRLGFARNNNAGTVDSSLEDVNIDLTQQMLSRSDRWSFGVDVHPLPRTTVSFDQFIEHDKLDTAYINNPADAYTLGVGGPSVSIPLYYPPCAVTTEGLPQPYITAPGVLNPHCNTGVFSYSRSDNLRTFLPTSQLALSSNYFRNLDVTASGTYSSGNSKVLNYNDAFHGLVSRTNETAYQVTGPAQTQRVSGNADLGLTYHINKSWSISDKFRWLDWRNSGAANYSTIGCYSNAAASETLSTPTGGTCNVPGITTTGFAPAGLTALSVAGYNTLEGERTYFNTATLNWAPSRRFSSYIGYRYGRREEKDSYLSNTFNTNTAADGTFVPAPNTVASPNPATASNPIGINKINQNIGLLGVVVRPTENWRVNADAELLTADNTFTQAAPRHEQRVRASTVYKLNRWASINGSAHFVESLNNWAENFGGPGVNLFPIVDPKAYGTKSHNRYYTAGASLEPSPKFGLDFGWTYMDQGFKIPACMVVTATVVAGSAPVVCPTTTNQTTVPATFNITASQNNIPVTQDYQENTSTGYLLLTYKPVHRVILHLGYDITSTTGNDNWLRGDTGLPLQVLGDQYGNAPGIPGNPGTTVTGAKTSAGTIPFLGPFPNQPLGGQDMYWHRLTSGFEVMVAKGVSFKGSYGYYNYSENQNLPANQVAALARNFHANTGTMSIHYSF